MYAALSQPPFRSLPQVIWVFFTALVPTNWSTPCSSQLSSALFVFSCPVSEANGGYLRSAEASYEGADV